MLASTLLALLPVLAAATPQYGDYSPSDSAAAGEAATASYWEGTSDTDSTSLGMEMATATATTSAATSSGSPARHTVVVGEPPFPLTPKAS